MFVEFMQSVCTVSFYSMGGWLSHFTNRTGEIVAYFHFVIYVECYLPSPKNVQGSTHQMIINIIKSNTSISDSLCYVSDSTIRVNSVLDRIGETILKHEGYKPCFIQVGFLLTTVQSSAFPLSTCPLQIMIKSSI
jgi:hypothetical protein